MTERNGIFAGDDPFVIVRAWLEEAARVEPNDPNAMALATVDADGLPNSRIVLLKAVEDDGFSFFTNYNSAKGRELDAAQKAAFVIHWKSLRRQIRVRGLVERLEKDASDAYYSSRSLGSRIGAWASDQSQPLASKKMLMAKVAAEGLKHGLAPKRPPHWGGYIIRPLELEFWSDGEFRLHDRFRWRRVNLNQDWEIARLNP